MQTNYLKLFIVVVLLHFTTINSRIVAPDTYERMIQKKTNDELKETYNAHREGLTAQPIEFPPEIEEDIKFTQTPRYKIDMFKVVIQEIARRCTATKTIDELANLADLFFKKDNPSTYERMIQKKTNDELKETYNARREGLTAQPIEFPPEIEKDIKFTQTPRYKIDMFKVVIQEIARRCTATKTIDELANLADLFFKKDNPNQEIKKRITSRNRRRSCRSQKNR